MSVILLVVIVAEHAGGVQLFRFGMPHGISGAVARHPVRVAWNNSGTALVGSSRAITRRLSQIEHHDAAGAGDKPIHLEAGPIADPVFNVESGCILLVDVQLAQTPDAIIPADGSGRSIARLAQGRGEG